MQPSPPGFMAASVCIPPGMVEPSVLRSRKAGQARTVQSHLAASRLPAVVHSGSPSACSAGQMLLAAFCMLVIKQVLLLLQRMTGLPGAVHQDDNQCPHLRMSRFSPEITPVVNVWSNPKAAAAQTASKMQSVSFLIMQLSLWQHTMTQQLDPFLNEHCLAANIE